jgi:acyl-[acyl-carrier-protein]-phospholipid O-acyltransferase/long-chain-fatty-acid--[acyl-carrier-protein] ligase
VPHGTVEQSIERAMGWEHGDTPTVFVTGVPDIAKGEALVLLTTREVVLEDLRSRLAADGVPNLWVPKIILRVEKIPMLGTGKTDLKGCRELALQAVK